MRVLVVMDEIGLVDVQRDTTFGFLLAAQAAGHEVWYCNQEHLFTDAQGAGAHCAPVSVKLDVTDHFNLGPWVDTHLDDFDTVWMRKDPPVDRAFLHATYVLDHTQALVLNAPSALRNANEKMYALHFPEFVPKTIVTRDMRRIRAAVEAHGEPMIVKPVDGHGGAGIFLLRADDRNLGSIVETLTHEGQRWVMLQEYLPESRVGDKRIILLDGEPRGAILRVPQENDNRGNIHVGGHVVATELTARDKEICAAVGARCKADGLAFVGIDVIGRYLTEVNVTSPTGIREIQQLGGNAIGAEFVDWVDRQLTRKA